jgi:hypothetical protein
MSTPTNQEILNAVKTAIKAILDGGAVQSYTVNGRNLQKYNLSELMDLQREYEQRVAAESGGATNYVSFADPE